MRRTFKIYSLSNFQICNEVLLTIVTMLYITSPWHLFHRGAFLNRFPSILHCSPGFCFPPSPGAPTSHVLLPSFPKWGDLVSTSIFPVLVSSHLSPFTSRFGRHCEQSVSECSICHLCHKVSSNFSHLPLGSFLIPCIGGAILVRSLLL